MRSHFTWFMMLAVTCVVAPYLLRMPARTARQWRYIAITIAFLAWLLAFMAPLRASAATGDGRARWDAVSRQGLAGLARSTPS